MADILQGLFDYLTGTGSIDAVRDAARKDFRRYTGGRVYRDRVLQGERADTVVAIWEDSSEQHYGTTDETDLRTQTVGIDVYSRESPDTHGSRRVRETWRAIHKAVTAYRGDMGEVPVEGCFLETEPFDAPIAPTDARNGWTQRLFSAYTLNYREVKTTVANPAGTLAPYAGVNIPDGWLLCDGSSLQTAVYPNLFSAIGYNYGGSGANFNLPDLRSRFPIGVGTGSGLSTYAIGAEGGSESATLAEENLPAHTHAVQIPARDDDGNSTVASGKVLANSPAGASPVQIYSTDEPDVTLESFASGSTGSGSAVSLLNPYVALNWIIKA